MLLERDDLLRKLDDLAHAADNRHGAIALVAGEAGIGKTTLLEEMRHRVSPVCDVLWGGCDALATPRPLGPIHDMAPALGNRVETMLARSSPPSELFDTILDSIESADKPVVLVFEDVHWADHATLDFLKFIGRRASMLRMLLVLSFRSDEITDDHPLAQILAALPDAYTNHFDIEPLSRQGVKTLGASSGYVDDELFEITGGNPFFVTELIAWQGSARGSVPASVKDAVAARLNRLAPAERDFLEMISVIPGSVSPGILQPLFGDNGDTLAMACVGRGFLMRAVNGSLRFRHELARLATLARLSGIQKRDCHAKVLAAMQESDEDHSFDRLVHHAAKAMDGKNVLEFAPAAAAKAAALGAHREAAAHLGTAIRFINEADPEMAATLYEEWAYEAGLALQISDDVIEARRHAVTLWRALGRIDKVGNNLRWLSRLHWYRGEAAEASHFADEAIRALESTEPSAERAMAYSLRSQLHMLNNRMAEAIDWGNRALDLAEQFDNTEVKIHSLNNIGTAQIFSGDPEGIKQMNTSLELALEAGHHEHAARVYTNLSENAVEFRNFELAERIISEGIAFDTHHDLDSWTHYLVGRLAQLRMDQGRLRDAETIAGGVLKLKRPTLLMRLPALIVLARVRTRFGSPDAHELASQALQNAMATDEVQYIIPARLTLIEAAWLNDAADKAAEHLDSLLRISKAELHRWDTADICIWARRLDFPMPESYASDLPPPQAAEYEGNFSKAARAWRKLSVPYAAALSQMQSNDPADAEQMARAIKALEKMEASAAVARARKIARELGIAAKMPRPRRGPYKSARNHPLGLTKREQDILRLVASGASNRDISERLKRSPRTVEHHVSSVLAKLNVANRMEAMLRVQNEPWLLPDRD